MGEWRPQGDSKQHDATSQPGGFPFFHPVPHDPAIRFKMTRRAQGSPRRTPAAGASGAEGARMQGRPGDGAQFALLIDLPVVFDPASHVAVLGVMVGPVHHPAFLGPFVFATERDRIPPA